MAESAASKIREKVREHYASEALAVESTAPVSAGCCGGPAPADTRWGLARYGNEATSETLGKAATASLGCGNPVAVAELHEGETVLDLGSGGGLDVLLSARRVGPTGFVYGLDMTDEMLALARRNQAEAGVPNVEFRKGEIEDIPLADDSVDVIISNCVINLSADKPTVFREAHRVLRPGGRLAVTDVVTMRPFTSEERADLASWSECIAGALCEQEYRDGLVDAGFTDVQVIPSHEVGDDAISAIIHATA